MKLAWYGKAFYFVELPRRFMVSIYAALVFRHFMPQPWMEWALVIACLAFDLLVARRAPDIRITKEDIEAKLALGAEPVFLTWSEVKTRLVWLTLGALLLSAIAWYWFTHGQQPVVASQLSTGGIVLAAIAYISALGIPLRTKRELKEGEKAFVMPGGNWRIFAYAIGLLPFLLAALLILWGILLGMQPAESTGGGPGFTGTLDGYILMQLTGYTLLFLHIFSSQLFILYRKISSARAALSSSVSSSN